MKLAPATIKALAPFIIGDQYPPSRKGTEIVDLINKYKQGPKDMYREGLPDIGKRNGQLPSKKEYIQHRLEEMSDTPRLRDLLNEVFTGLENKEQAITTLNDILGDEGLSVAENENQLIIKGGVVDNRPPVVNEAYFRNIESQIIDELDEAKISINAAVAWFTNQRLADKLKEKKAQGLDVQVIVYDDHVNTKYGVNLDGIPLKRIKAERGGKMHHKFCVIDNQTVINGSYNWSENAEHRNEENIDTLRDPKQAIEYSLEFRRLKNLD